MSEIHLPMRWDGRNHHVFDSKGNSFAYLLRNTHRGDYDQWDRDGQFITKAINEHATLTARVAELEQENAKLLDEVTERRFTDECTDKLLDEREAENKRLRLVARAVVDFLNEKVKL